MGTESHLNDSIYSSEIFPKDYSVHRKDRNIHGGGVFVLVDKLIPSSKLEIESSCEVIWVILHLKGPHNIILGAFYTPPNSTPSVWEDLSECLIQIRQRFPTTMIILGGDFNCPGVDWVSGSLVDSYVTATFRKSLIALAHNSMLEQVVIRPTRGNNILDLCFTTHPDYIEQCATVPGFSDHDAVIVDLTNLRTSYNKHERKIYLYNRANWDVVRDEISVVSDMYFNLNENSTRTVEQNWNFFHENILSIVDKNIPAKNITASNRLPWMTSELKRMIKRKQRLYNRAKRFNRPSDWKLYKDMQSRVRITLKQLRLKYLTESLKPDDDNNRRKTFWRFIKSQKQDTTEISSLQLPTGQVTAPKEIAEVLNNLSLQRRI